MEKLQPIGGRKLMNKQSVVLPGAGRKWGSYISKYQPDSSDVLDNMFTAGSKNFITDQTGMIDKRQGGVQWNRTHFGNAAQDTYEAIFNSGARHFLRVGAGVLEASTGTGLFDVITSGYSTFGNFEWATYQNRVYGDNGINSPQVYDVATSYGGVTYSFTTGKTRPMGAQAPLTAPTNGAYTAGGSVPVGSHTYVITFVYYGSEESNGSPSSVVQTATGGTQTGHLSSIPVGGYGVTARNVYRDNNDGVYLLLATINDNTTTTYTDTLLIGSTPTPIPTDHNVPPTFSKIALYLDALFIAPSGQTNIINFSNAGAPDIFPPGNFITCQSDDIVTALYVYNGKLYVFGLHSFGSIEGTTPDTFYYHNINNFIGCVDNRSIQVRSIVSVPTLWWLSTKGFYYSNGYTVEYGSDFIQDLVNLNISQVNFTTGKNTQQSFADFAGDTSSPGIDINSVPGAINVLNPSKAYSSTTDWLAGLSLVNIKTSDNPFLEVPTQFAPSLVSGMLSGSAQQNGNNVTLSIGSNFTGAGPSATNIFFNSGSQHVFLAQPLTVPVNGTITTISVIGPSSSATAQLKVYSSLGGSLLFTGSIHSSPGLITETVNLSVSAGQTVWAITSYQLSVGTFTSFDDGTYAFGNTTPAEVSFTSFTSGFGLLGTGALSIGGISYTFSQTPVPSAGTWTSLTYDSGSLNAVAASIFESGVYPSPSIGSITVYASTAANMAGAVSQTVSTPNGSNSLSLSGYRYWQIVISLSTSNNQIVPTMGTPVLTFNITGTWISQPINATTDNTGWGTLTFTGNVPGGTSVTLNIATSPDNITYSSFGPIGSAVTQPWAKIQVILTTGVANVTSPSLSSVTLTWNLTSQIESTPIDTGTTPSGFGVVQWNQPTSAGTVTFYIRTATTALGLAGATYVAVLNGAFPNLTALRFVQWKFILMATANNTPEITSVTVNWFISSGTVGVRVSSLFFNKTYYVSVATTGATANNTLIQLDQFGNWRIQKDASIGTFLSYFNTLYFTDGITDKIFNGFIANTDDGVAITMDVRTKAWSANNDLFLKVPRAMKITGINTGTTIHAYYSPDRGTTWIEMLNEQGVAGFTTDISGTEFVVLFVPDATTLVSGRTLMFRIVSSDVFPCSIMNYAPSFYSRKGRYLSNA
jgi:hypothetical protein